MGDGCDRPAMGTRQASFVVDRDRGAQTVEDPEEDQRAGDHAKRRGAEPPMDTATSHPPEALAPKRSNAQPLSGITAAVAPTRWCNRSGSS